MTPEPSPSAAPSIAPSPGPAGAGAATAVLAALFFLLGAAGLPISEIIQDTLKSVLASAGLLLAMLLLFLRQGTQPLAWRWHPVLWLPALLAAYAAVSVLWAHPHQAVVECVRWLLVTGLAWLTLQVASPERARQLALGIACGAFAAALWAALQFWVSFGGFPQGRHPASTFGNRNFLAEYLAMALPFGVLVLAQARVTWQIVALAAGCGLTVLAVMMTGTRSALAAVGLQLVVVFPLVAWRWRAELAWATWSRAQWGAAAGVFAAVVLGLGFVPTGNSSVMEDMSWQRVTPIQRALLRSETFADAAKDESLGVRVAMWRDTLDMIRATPVTGVGAGSWEIQMPRFQKGAAVELDYFAHNEYLQLVAEYGVVGWLFLALLLGGLARAAWSLWAARGLRSPADGPVRAFALASLLGLLLVSLTGFPWHMAATGALLAVALGLVGASAARQGAGASGAATPRRILHLAGAGCAAAALALAAWVSTEAMRAEWKINAAAQLARGITATGEPGNPQLASARAEAVKLILEGTALNPHNRRIAAPVADELARWGDWKNATEVWERTASSRPYVVVILTNVARGYLRTGQPAKARVFVERAREVAPQGNYVRALDVLVTGQGGDEARALSLARSALDDGVADYDLFNYVYTLATKAGDHGLAARAMAARLKQWPREEPATAWLQLAEARQRQGEADAALDAYRAALGQATPAQRPAVAERVPAALRGKLGL